MPNYMIKFNLPGAEWHDIDEYMATLLIQKHYPNDDIPTKLLDLQRGNPLKVGPADIEAWPTGKEN